MDPINALKEVFTQQENSNQKADQELQEEIQVIGFEIGDEEFAIPILNVLEIVKPIEYTRVPRAPDYVLGVFNLRGNVFPLIDLRLKFNMPPIKMGKYTCYLLVKHGDRIAGFAIDRLSQALKFKESEIDPIPDGIGKKEELMQGVGKKGNRIITIIKAENLLRKTF